MGASLIRNGSTDQARPSFWSADRTALQLADHSVARDSVACRTVLLSQPTLGSSRDLDHRTHHEPDVLHQPAPSRVISRRHGPLARFARAFDYAVCTRRCRSN